MYTAKIQLTGISPYSQSRQHGEPEFEKEKKDDYEARTWRKKCTVNERGEVVIPSGGLKQALDSVDERREDEGEDPRHHHAVTADTVFAQRPANEHGQQ